MILSNQIKDHLKGPKSSYAGTRDKEFRCEIVRVVGVTPTGHDSIKFFIAEATGAKTLDNVRSNKIVTLSTTNIFTSESYQIKGRLINARPATEEENTFVRDYMASFDEAASKLGFEPGMLSSKLLSHPALAIEFVADQIFDQTPKVGTGKLVSSV